MAYGKLKIEISRETLATIREVLEADLQKLEDDNECEKHFIHCIAIIDALDELPEVK